LNARAVTSGPAARCNPPAAGYADLEVGSLVEVLVMPEASPTPPVRMIKPTEKRKSGRHRREAWLGLNADRLPLERRPRRLRRGVSV
jgi:hypothetical protein